MSKAFELTASDRGIFDPSLPVQGIFDPTIFDTQLAAAIETMLLPAFVHGNQTITVAVHGNEVITIK